MADAQARRAAIKKASKQVRAGGVFRRASSSSMVSGAGRASTAARPAAQKRH